MAALCWLLIFVFLFWIMDGFENEPYHPEQTNAEQSDTVQMPAPEEINTSVKIWNDPTSNCNYLVFWFPGYDIEVVLRHDENGNPDCSTPEIENKSKG